MPRISVVVPFYNEEENIGLLYSALISSLEPTGLSFELIFVDDGSQDRTAKIAADLARNDSRLYVVKLRGNSGQTAALAAGIAQARGQILITMDGDLQSDPLDIELMVEEIEAGNDIVVGWRHNRKDAFLSRKLPSTLANWLIGKVTGIEIRDNGSPLKAYRASLIKEIPLYAEMHRFIPAMASIAGARISEIKVRHHARLYGESKYGLSRTYKVLLDLLVIKTLTTFIARPLRWFTLLSMPFLLTSLICFGHLAYSLLKTNNSFSMIIASTALVYLFSASILISNGILGELIYKLGDLQERRFSKLTEQRLL
jgi:glycosyltransferase involved in cell wall biosynthesis